MVKPLHSNSHLGILVQEANNFVYIGSDPRCPLPPDVANARAIQSGDRINDTVTYICNENFRFADRGRVRTIVCTRVYTWSITKLECIGKAISGMDTTSIHTVEILYYSCLSKIIKPDQNIRLLWPLLTFSC